MQAIRKAGCHLHICRVVFRQINPVIQQVTTRDYCVFHCLSVSKIISKSKLLTRLLCSVQNTKRSLRGTEKQQTDVCFLFCLFVCQLFLSFSAKPKKKYLSVFYKSKASIHSARLSVISIFQYTLTPFFTKKRRIKFTASTQFIMQCHCHEIVALLMLIITTDDESHKSVTCSTSGFPRKSSEASNGRCCSVRQK